ncbi:YceD family protein [Desulfothermobacter acidiphilus]|uniref:YceD family protein n=1 Tax=Desulfothermobacter acidiphilus TaxID=1938353 RepID=UPI003F8907FF
MNVAQLKKTPAESRRYVIRERLDFLAGEGGQKLPLLVPVELDLTLTNARTYLLAVGEVLTVVELNCSRCLKPFPYTLKTRWEEKWRLLPEGEKDQELSGEELDLAPCVLESLVLALPMKPLCREDCAGLCPECGHDLNQGPCSCSLAPLDPRWAELGKWLSSEEGGGKNGSAAE